MAHPITFKPQPHDPQIELERELAAAPREHAAALLSTYELLQTAHEQGVLDLLRAAVGGRDVLAEKLGEGLALPETIAATRNAIALARLLAAIDPAVLHALAKALAEASGPKLAREKEETEVKTAPLRAAGLESSAPKRPPFAAASGREKASEPPSLWQLFRRATSKDARRGMVYAIDMLTAVGRARRGE